MTNSDFLAGLKRSLPEDAWPWVIAALRQDETVWKSLQEETGPAVLQSTAITRDLSPAGLANLAMGGLLDLEYLCSTPMQPGLGDDGKPFRLPRQPDEKPAGDPPEDQLPAQKPQPASPLGAALLQALTWREKRRVRGTWEELSRQPGRITPTTVACLYGILPDPAELLQVLVHATPENGLELGLHALLSNPVPPAEHIASLWSVARQLPADRQVDLLHLVSVRRPDLAAAISERLLEQEADPALTAVEAENFGHRIDRLGRMLRLAEFRSHAYQYTAAVKLLGDAARVAQQVQAGLLAHMARAAALNMDSQAELNAWENALRLEAASPDYTAGYALSLLNLGRSADAQARLSTLASMPSFQSNHPWTLLANARLAHQRGNLETARADAMRAVEARMALSATPEAAGDGRMEASLVRLLIDLELPHEAVSVIQSSLQHFPNDPELLELACRAYLAARQPAEAVYAAHLAAGIAPHRLELRRRLAVCLEHAGQWNEALLERTILLARQDAPGTDDSLDLAACALQAGEVARAQEICQQLLKEDETNGRASILMGAASARLGEKRQAFEYLMRAIHYAPENPSAWLSLARLYSQEGMLQKAIETLQAAGRAAPDLPDVYLGLGEAHLDNGAPSQALPPLRRAADLARQPSASMLDIETWTPMHLLNRGSSPRPLPDQIALRLGQTLLQLGHHGEAGTVLAEAFNRAPEDPEISRAYALSLLASRQTREAIAPLKSLVGANPPDAGPYLDYARCVLANPGIEPVQEHLQTAVAAIRRAREIDPANDEALALQAEILSAVGDAAAALGAYQDALDTPLAKQPAWVARLSLGLGQAALELGQIETAVAALQEASQAAPDRAEVHQHLSVACESAGLAAEALTAARAARNLASGQADMQLWFAGMVLCLKGQPGLAAIEIQNEAIAALEAATRLAPERADVWLKLGQTWQKMGRQLEARQAYAQLARLNETSASAAPQDLYVAARGLLEVDDPGGAAECLERIQEKWHMLPATSGPSQREVLVMLVEARSRQGHPEAARQAIQQAIQLDPEDPGLYIQKAGLLLAASGSKAEIQACVATAIRLKPQDPILHRQASHLLRSVGDLPAALEYADRMMQITTNAPGLHLQARILAAGISQAMLQHQKAHAYLEYEPPAAGELSMDDLPTIQDYHCQRAGLALENWRDRAWEDLPAPAITHPADPRTLAIQSRLALRRNEPSSADQYLRTSLEATRGQDQVSIDVLRAQSLAAIELQDWKTAFELVEKIRTLAPLEPQTHLETARALVLRAEFQRLCQVLEIIQHAPGDEALLPSAQQAFEESIQASRELLLEQAQQATHPGIVRWQARGQAVFTPSQENALALASLPLNSEDTAARIACLRQIGETGASGMAAREFPQNPLVLLQLAISLAGDKPRQAMAAIHVAADVLAQQKTDQVRTEPAGQNILPMVNFLTARLFYENGNRMSDQQSAMQAIQTALDLWPAEPRWHRLAAEVHLNADPAAEAEGLSQAIRHLQSAVRLEPQDAQPHLRLGEILLKTGDPEQAARAFETASQINPEHPQAWLWLAQTSLAAGDPDKAAAHAERAVALAPNQVEPLLLRGEIALAAKNPRGAYSRAQTALRIQPENPNALLLMAHTLDELGRTDEALEMLERVLPLTTEPLTLSLERVRMIHRAHGQEAALSAAQELSDRYPDQSTAMALLAELMEAAGDDDKAIRTAQRALRGNENGQMLPDGDQADLHFLLGRLLRRAGQLDQAVYHLNESVRLSPRKLEAYIELGQVNTERRQHNQAMSAYRQAMTVAPQDHRAYHMTGLALKESKDYIGAERMLRRAAELAPDDLSIHRLLAAVVALNLVHNQREPIHDGRINRYS